MYTSGYNKLFWGMMFIIFNINLGPINILPDFIGYLLIYSGLSSLASQHPIYEKGKVPAIILTVLTLKDIVNFQTVNLLNNYSQVNFFSMALGLVTAIINLYLIYIICIGIYLLADERGFEELKESARLRFKVYLVITIIMQFYMSFLVNLSNSMKAFIFIFIIINIITVLIVAALFRKAGTRLGEQNPEGHF